MAPTQPPLAPWPTAAKPPSGIAKESGGGTEPFPGPPITSYIDLTSDHVRWALNNLSKKAQKSFLSALGWDGYNLLTEWLSALTRKETEVEEELTNSPSLTLSPEASEAMIKYGILKTHRTRHLKGISLRNLSLAPPAESAHIVSIDDDHVVYTSQREPSSLHLSPQPKLEHSHSATDLLEQASLDGNASTGAPSRINGYAKPPPRRSAQRRRSTMSWAKDTPSARQKHLKDATSNRRLDVFVSIHTFPTAEPFYITETQYQTMNVDFNQFDLSELKEISRREGFTLKIWAKGEFSLGYIHLLELDVHLGSLTCIGKTMEDLNVPVKDNTVFFHFTDGVFTDLESIASMHIPPVSFPIPRMENNRPTPTSSFEALMQLRNITECIEDAKHTREILASSIEGLIKENQDADDTVTEAARAKADLDATGFALAAAKRDNARLNAQLASMKANLAERGTALKSGHESIGSDEKKVGEDEAYSDYLKAKRDESTRALVGQIRRIATQYVGIFPIEPIAGHPLCFTIQGLYLPNAGTLTSQGQANSNLPPADEDQTAAALGYAAHIIDSLATKLFIPLPFAITYQGSSSSVFDPLSSASTLGGPANQRLPPNTAPTRQNSPWRVFYLNQKIANAAKFNWAVYLLNKCVEEVMSAKGLKMVDPRHTLANLKYLLTVLSSGKGNTPGRRVGTIRGLAMKDNDESGGSRDSSVGSVVTAMAKMMKMNEREELEDIIRAPFEKHKWEGRAPVGTIEDEEESEAGATSRAKGKGKEILPTNAKGTGQGRLLIGADLDMEKKIVDAELKEIEEYKRAHPERTAIPGLGDAVEAEFRAKAKAIEELRAQPKGKGKVL